MFVYEKKLQYPEKVATPNPKLAAVIISQYGGPDGELGASLRYLSQRYSMPYAELKGLLTDIGTEELGHLEMIGAIVHQLTRDLTEEQIRTAGFDTYFVDRTAGVYPTAASGSPAGRTVYPSSTRSLISAIWPPLSLRPICGNFWALPATPKLSTSSSPCWAFSPCFSACCVSALWIGCPSFFS